MYRGRCGEIKATAVPGHEGKSHTKTRRIISVVAVETARLDHSRDHFDILIRTTFPRRHRGQELGAKSNT